MYSFRSIPAPNNSALITRLEECDAASANNLELIAKHPEQASQLMQFLGTLKNIGGGLYPLDPESCDAMCQQIEYSRNVVSALSVLRRNENALLTSENIQRICRQTQYANTLAEAFECLQAGAHSLYNYAMRDRLERVACYSSHVAANLIKLQQVSNELITEQILNQIFTHPRHASGIEFYCSTLWKIKQGKLEDSALYSFPYDLREKLQKASKNKKEVSSPKLDEALYINLMERVCQYPDRAYSLGYGLRSLSWLNTGLNGSASYIERMFQNPMRAQELGEVFLIFEKEENRALIQEEIIERICQYYLKLDARTSGSNNSLPQAYITLAQASNELLTPEILSRVENLKPDSMEQLAKIITQLWALNPAFVQTELLDEIEAALQQKSYSYRFSFPKALEVLSKLSPTPDFITISLLRQILQAKEDNEIIANAYIYLWENAPNLMQSNLKEEFFTQPNQALNIAKSWVSIYKTNPQLLENPKVASLLLQSNTYSPNIAKACMLINQQRPNLLCSEVLDALGDKYVYPTYLAHALINLPTDLPQTWFFHALSKLREINFQKLPHADEGEIYEYQQNITKAYNLCWQNHKIKPIFRLNQTLFNKIFENFRRVYDIVEGLYKLSMHDEEFIREDIIELLCANPKYIKEFIYILSILGQLDKNLITFELIKKLGIKPQGAKNLVLACNFAVKQKFTTFIKDYILQLAEAMADSEKLIVLAYLLKDLVNAEEVNILLQRIFKIPASAEDLTKAILTIKKQKHELLGLSLISLLFDYPGKAHVLAATFVLLARVNADFAAKKILISVCESGETKQIYSFLSTLVKLETSLLTEELLYKLLENARHLSKLEKIISIIGKIKKDLLSIELIIRLLSQPRKLDNLREALDRLDRRLDPRITIEHSLISWLIEQAKPHFCVNALIELSKTSIQFLSPNYLEYISQAGENSEKLAEGFITLWKHSQPIFPDDNQISLLSRHAAQARKLAAAICTLEKTAPDLLMRVGIERLAQKDLQAETIANIIQLLWQKNPSLITEPNLANLFERMPSPAIFNVLVEYYPDLLTQDNFDKILEQAEHTIELAEAVCILYRGDEIQPNLYSQSKMKKGDTAELLNQSFFDKLCSHAKEAPKVLNVFTYLWRISPSFVEESTFDQLAAKTDHCQNLISLFKLFKYETYKKYRINGPKKRGRYREGTEIIDHNDLTKSMADHLINHAEHAGALILAYRALSQLQQPRDLLIRVCQFPSLAMSIALAIECLIQFQEQHNEFYIDQYLAEQEEKNKLKQEEIKKQNEEPKEKWEENIYTLISKMDSSNDYEKRWQRRSVNVSENYLTIEVLEKFLEDSVPETRHNLLMLMGFLRNDNTLIERGTEYSAQEIARLCILELKEKIVQSLRFTVSQLPNKCLKDKSSQGIFIKQDLGSFNLTQWRLLHKELEEMLNKENNKADLKTLVIKSTDLKNFSFEQMNLFISTLSLVAPRLEKLTFFYGEINSSHLLDYLLTQAYKAECTSEFLEQAVRVAKLLCYLPAGQNAWLKICEKYGEYYELKNQWLEAIAIYGQHQADLPELNLKLANSLLVSPAELVKRNEEYFKKLLLAAANIPYSTLNYPEKEKFSVIALQGLIRYQLPELEAQYQDLSPRLSTVLNSPYQPSTNNLQFTSWSTLCKIIEQLIGNLEGRSKKQNSIKYAIQALGGRNILQELEEQLSKDGPQKETKENLTETITAKDIQIDILDMLSLPWDQPLDLWDKWSVKLESILASSKLDLNDVLGALTCIYKIKECPSTEQTKQLLEFEFIQAVIQYYFNTSGIVFVEHIINASPEQLKTWLTSAKSNEDRSHVSLAHSPMKIWKSVDEGSTSSYKGKEEKSITFSL